jgi:CHAD domain-containing protein
VVAGKLAHDRLSGNGEPRAYKLLAGEALPAGIARVARGRLSHAIDELENGHDSDKAVHEARKDLKKVRSLLRLTRADLGDAAYRRENARFRDLGRGLSGVRDAKAMIEALDKLVEAGLLRSTAQRVRRELDRHRDSLGGGDGASVRAAVSGLEAARSDAKEWPLKRDRWRALEPGLRRAYRRGRRGMHRANDKRSTEALHEWRKRVKDLWYHLTLLQETWPAVLSSEADEAHALSDRLGDDHDLAVLGEFAAARGLDSQRLAGAIEARRDELQRDAFAIGKRLYAERPRVFADRLHSYWSAWRAEPVPR